jgi:hypothetical protein
MRLAADWLNAYDDESEEYNRIIAVAIWLENEANRREENSVVFKVARKAGVSTSRARAKLREIQKRS